jgi:Pyruvate/2-oxoacid:ferredoxin oxidoreductase gamma subunit
MNTQNFSGTELSFDHPTQSEVQQTLKERAVIPIFVPESLSIPANETVGEQLGESHINVLMLGTLCGYTRLLPRTVLEHAIAQRLPLLAEQNLDTFAAGWNLGEEYRLNPEKALHACG